MLKLTATTIVLGSLFLAPTISTAKTSESPIVESTATDAWMSTPFLGDDRPYKLSRLNIDKSIEQGQKPDDLVKRYRELARRQPNDPKAQFRWAYASYQATKKTSSLSADLSGAFLKLQSFKPPHPYEYSRLRFILEARILPRQKLEVIGERLLQRNPNDFDVKYNLIKVIDPTVSYWDKQKAILYCRQLIKAFPKKNSPYSMLGFRCWPKRCV